MFRNTNSASVIVRNVIKSDETHIYFAVTWCSSARVIFGQLSPQEILKYPLYQNIAIFQSNTVLNRALRWPEISVYAIN